MTRKFDTRTLPFPVYLPPEYNIALCNIQFFIDGENERFVKTVHRKKHSPNASRIPTLDEYYRVAHTDALLKWQEKYGDSMPDCIEGQWAEVTPAYDFLYDGSWKLTEEERVLILDLASSCDLTIDMVWLIVEGLNWRPGVPVDANDPKWEAIWAEELGCGGYIEIVYDFIGMSSPDYKKDERQYRRRWHKCVDEKR